MVLGVPTPALAALLQADFNILATLADASTVSVLLKTGFNSCLITRIPTDLRQSCRCAVPAGWSFCIYSFNPSL